MGLSVVTGANRGIGLELCRQLSARGDDVIAVCRQTSQALDLLDVQVLEGVDVTDTASLVRLCEKLDGLRVDLLINNAGLLEPSNLDSIDFAAVRRQIDVNAVGPLRVTSAVLPFMTTGSKVAIITSNKGSIADNVIGGDYGYRMSKAAVNAAGVSLARDLESRGIAVVLLHPGTVRTDMTSATHAGRVVQEPAQAVRNVLDCIDALTLSSTGSFISAASGATLPW